MAADTFFFRRNGLFYDVYNVRTGEVVEELLDCVAEARNYVEKHTADAAEAYAAEQAALAAERAEYLAQEREKDLIYIAIKRMYDQEKPANDPRNFAVTEILAAIDSLGRPDTEQKEAA